MPSTECFLLVSKGAVEHLLEDDPEFRQHLDRSLAPGGGVRRFPNGAIDIEETGDEDDDDSAHPFAQFVHGSRIAGMAAFRSLGPFEPKRFYLLIKYSADYQKKAQNRGGVPERPERLGATIALRVRTRDADDRRRVPNSDEQRDPIRLRRRGGPMA